MPGFEDWGLGKSGHTFVGALLRFFMVDHLAKVHIDECALFEGLRATQTFCWPMLAYGIE